MHDLVNLDNAYSRELADTDLLANARRLIDDDPDVLRFAAAAQAANTQRAYRSAWNGFQLWCATKGVRSLPAEPESVGAFLSARAKAGIKPSTLAITLAAIRDRHRKAHLSSPTETDPVKLVASGIRRTFGVAPRQVLPATAEAIAAMLSHVDRKTMKGKRDAALLLIGFGAAFRRSEVVAIDVEHLSFGPRGVDIFVPSSKTDQLGEGATISIPNGTALKPVLALRRWLDAAEIESGPVFRRVRAHGHVQAARLTDAAVAEIVKLYAERAGLDAVEMSGHSLRAGFVTSSIARNAPLTRIADQTRHKSLDTLRRYARFHERFEQHPGDGFL